MDIELVKVLAGFGMAGLILGAWVWDSMRKEKIIKEIADRFYEQSKITNEFLGVVKTTLDIKLK